MKPGLSIYTLNSLKFIFGLLESYAQGDELPRKKFILSKPHENRVTRETHFKPKQGIEPLTTN